MLLNLPYNVAGNVDQFTVELHHGGFFVGYGHLRAYVDEKINWFDYCEMDTWSLLWFDDFIQQLGYTKQPSLKVYWLLPGRELDDGLRVIVSDSDINAMNSVVNRVKNLIVYIDHDDTIAVANWDEVAIDPSVEMPKVFNPIKVKHIEKNEALPEFYRNISGAKDEHKVTESEFDSGSESGDSDFLDSDNEFEVGDDDLYVDYVDVDVDDEGVEKGIKTKRGLTLVTREEEEEESTDDEGLQLPADQIEGQVNLKFKTFRQEDINNPSFKVGMVFDSVETLRKAITEYGLKNRVDIKMPRNDQRRLRAHCADGCPWTLYASKDSRVKAFMVKTYYGKHNCQKEWVLKRCTSNWLADKYLDSFRADDKMSLANFGKTMQKEWNLTPSRSKLARARRIALKKIYGDESEQYNQLWDYGHELRRSNPGSAFYLNIVNNHFSTCYMSLDACKRGFLYGCRPLICLDGCHIKTKFGGQILTAVGIDPNDCIYPIAIGVVEVESLASWKWFLQTLKIDLGIDNTYPWTIMTDKQKGLIPAVEQVFPESEHRFCVRHLWSNFRDAGFKGDILKNQLWACARSSTVNRWNHNMDKMRELDQEAYEWLEKMPPKTWVRAFFSEFPKSDLLLNNNCEVFNKYILEAREMPILSMLQRVKQQLMTRYYTKQLEAAEFVGTICPKIRKKVAKNAEFANVCYALPSGQGIFQVNERENQYIVDIRAKECECRRWQLTGIPCQHAITCLRHERIQSESVVHECYSIQSFHRAYERNILPCKDMSTWEKVNGTPVLPPVYEKKVGRPPKSRRKQPHEIQGKHGPTMSKHGVIIRCGYCRGENHNAKGCYLKKMGIRPEDYIPNGVPPVAQEHAPEIFSHEEININAEAPQGSQSSTQEAPALLLSQMSSTMLMRMMEQVHLFTLPFSVYCHVSPSLTCILHIFFRVHSQPLLLSLQSHCRTPSSSPRIDHSQGQLF